MQKFNGIVPVLLTPIDRHGNVDKSGLCNLIDYYIEKEVSGLWVLGTGGEDMGLTYRQRVEVAEIASEKAGHLMKLVVGTSFYSMKESFDFMSETASLNFSAYHAMPYHPKVSEKQIVVWYEGLADRAQKPFWAYTSGNWAQYISPKMVATLKAHGNFEGVKYSTSNAVDLQEVSFLNDQDFQVISAVVKTYYIAMCLGITATTSVEASVFLDEIREVESAFKYMGRNEALVAQQNLLEVLKYPSPSAKDNFLRVAELKYLASKKVQMETFMTQYYRNLTENEKRDLDYLCGKKS